MRVELVYFTGCPNVARARELVRRCLEQCGFGWAMVEMNTDDPSTPATYRRFASPTVLVDGVDVSAATSNDAPACRLDLPSETDLIAAIRGKHEERR